MITPRDPNTIHLGGDITILNENIAGVAITPGMEIELYDDSGKMKWRPLANATHQATGIFALEKTLHNKTVDDVYAIGELVLAAKFHPGSSVWALIPIGTDLLAGDPMQPNGNGMLKEATSVLAADNLAAYKSLESSGGAVAAISRHRTHVN